MELIDKAALVAEIERRKYQFVSQAESFRKIGKEDKESYFAALASNMNSLLSFLDTIKTKEVDLEKECKTYLKNNFTSKEAPDEFLTTQMQLDDMVLFAKHFYELGLKAKGE